MFLVKVFDERWALGPASLLEDLVLFLEGFPVNWCVLYEYRSSIVYKLKLKEYNKLCNVPKINQHHIVNKTIGTHRVDGLVGSRYIRLVIAQVLFNNILALIE